MYGRYKKRSCRSTNCQMCTHNIAGTRQQWSWKISPKEFSFCCCLCANTQLCIQKLGARNKKSGLDDIDQQLSISAVLSLFSAWCCCYKGILLFVITCTISCQVYSESIACLLFCEERSKRLRLGKAQSFHVTRDSSDYNLFPWNLLTLELRFLHERKSDNSEMSF